MNEQIRELIKQHDVDITIDGMGYGEGNIEDLIKLIVKECAKIAEARPIWSVVGGMIRDHFGVEE